MSTLLEILKKHENEVLTEWLADQVKGGSRRSDLTTDADLRRDSLSFLQLLRDALGTGNTGDVTGKEWGNVMRFLDELSRTRALAGYTPSETANFVLSLKQALFRQLRRDLEKDGTRFAEETWAITSLFDQLGLYTTESFQRSREDVIRRQQEEMLELSTPVVKLWEGILALPLIGTLDSARTQVVMETLLQKVVETGSEIAIIDITGVPHVDTLVAQHLIKTMTAAKLMGADCILSGIRPQIAQTIVHLGVNLGEITTKASLSDAFLVALQRTGRKVVRVADSAASRAAQQTGHRGSEGAGAGFLS
jgi:rsbT co-antagonist protein RsbR